MLNCPRSRSCAMNQPARSSGSTALAVRSSPDGPGEVLADPGWRCLTNQDVEGQGDTGQQAAQPATQLAKAEQQREQPTDDEAD